MRSLNDAGPRPSPLRCAVLGAWLLGASLLGHANRAIAHGFSPALLELREQRDGTALVLWKTSPTVPAGARLEPVLPERCRAVSEPISGEAGEGITRSWTVECGAAGLVGARIAVRDLESARTDALVRVALADGRTLQAVLRPDAPALEVPARPSGFELLRSYGWLGLASLFGRLDHLLFVLGLLLLARGGRALAETVVALGVGQSLTLSLAVLASLELDSRVIGFASALAVLALAVEIARPPSEPPSLARRRAWLVAFALGLLNGFDFADALERCGLPGSESPLALLFFNLGVEGGVILAAIGGTWLLVGALARAPRALQRLAWLPSYAIGALGAAACLERAADLFR